MNENRQNTFRIKGIGLNKSFNAELTGIPEITSIGSQSVDLIVDDSDLTRIKLQFGFYCIEYNGKEYSTLEDYQNLQSILEYRKTIKAIDNL